MPAIRLHIRILLCLILCLSSCGRKYKDKTYNFSYEVRSSHLLFKNEITFAREGFDLLISASFSKDCQQREIPVKLLIISPHGKKYTDSLVLRLMPENCTKYQESFRSCDYEWLYRQNVSPGEYGNWKICFCLDKSLEGKVFGTGIRIWGGSEVSETMVPDSIQIQKEISMKEKRIQRLRDRRIQNRETVFIDQQKKENRYQ